MDRPDREEPDVAMLTFYENRAGKNLSATRKTKIEEAKDELSCTTGRDYPAARAVAQLKS